MDPETEEWATMAAGIIERVSEYLEEKGYAYTVMGVKEASNLMLWNPDTVLVVLEPKKP